MNQYVLLGGTYTDSGGVRYMFDKERETIVVSPSPLDEMYKGMFRRVGGPALTTSPIADGEFAGHPEAVIEATTPDQQPAVDPGIGMDLTADYPEAKAAGLKVFRRRSRLFVTPEGDPTKPIHKGGGFVTPVQARRCVNQFVEMKDKSDPAVVGR